MKLYILILAATVLTTLAAAQNRVEWKPGLQLTEQHFKGLRPDTPTLRSFHLSFGLDISQNDDDMDTTRSFNNAFTNFFVCDESWVDLTDATKFRYATGAFDLNEWMTRQLRKQLNENRGKLKKEGYTPLMTEVRIQFEKLSSQYQDETEDGNNLDAMVKWENKIAENLTLLSEYCKTCEPRH
jgi:hypothetical protein